MNNLSRREQLAVVRDNLQELIESCISSLKDFGELIEGGGYLRYECPDFPNPEDKLKSLVEARECCQRKLSAARLMLLEFR